MRNWVVIVAVGTAVAVAGCGQQPEIKAERDERGGGEARAQAAGPGEQVRAVSVPALKRVLAVSGAARGAGDQPSGAVQAQIDQVFQYVRGKEFDLAERGLDALERQKVGWSAATKQECGPKVERAWQALSVAKGGRGGNREDRGH